MMTPQLEEYILSHTTAPSALRVELERSAHLRLIRPRMLSGHLQGNLLAMLTRLSGARKVLEIGTYSGYAAHAMAEALPDGGEVHTLECDDEMEDFIRHYIDKAPWGDRIHLHIGDAMMLLPDLLQRHRFDLVYMDANKREYPQYFDLLMQHLPSGALILADNTLWDGKVVTEAKESDVQTKRIQEFNRLVHEDPRVENLILPLRDGLSLIRVK